MSRPKILIIGCDFPAFHIFWNSFSKPKNDVIKFIYVPPFESINDQVAKQNDSFIPPIIIHKGKCADIGISHLNDLENIIRAEKVDKCIILIQNIPMKYLASISHRILSTGSCGIQFFKPKDFSASSSKPIIAVSSLSNEVGKTQICRYCIDYLSQYRNIAVIMPIVQPDEKTIQLINISNQKKFAKKKPFLRNEQNNALTLYQSCVLPHFEFLNFEEAIQQKEWFSEKTLLEIENYFKCGAFCIYVSADINRALIQAERRAHIIIYDSYQSEIPFIQTQHRICVATSDTLCNIMNKTQWPGIVNLYRSEKVVIITKGPEIMDQKTKFDIIKMFEEKRIGLKEYPSSNPMIKAQISNLKAQKPSSYIKNNNSSGSISKPIEIKKIFFVNSINENDFYDNLSISSSCTASFSESSNTFANSSNEFITSIDSNNSTNNNNNNDNNNNDSNSNNNIYTPRNNDRKIYKDTIISVTQDIVETDSSSIQIFPRISDPTNKMISWLSRFYITFFKPPLQPHFKAQVGILSSMASSSDKELRISNHTSANRGALCRLFLSSHLPPGFRVTNGEIIDANGNCTGQLDVVIVNDSAPYMTIGASNGVIAPILADTVLGVVEVKALMDPDNLKKALSQLRPVKSLMPMHETLQTTDGTVIKDPLGGKIITGIFAFNMSKDSLDVEIPKIIKLYPKVADFVVIPGKFGYFLIDTLRVCGITINEENSNIVNDYVRYDADGIGLALIFGILNTIAAKRRFSGSNFVRYLSGKWEERNDENY